MTTRRKSLLILALALAAPAVAASASGSDSAFAQTLAPVTAADRSIGRADAPVTVVEYASFACNHCADWHRFVYPAFKSRFIDTGQVRLVFRNLPTLPEEMSMPGAAPPAAQRPSGSSMSPRP